MSAPGSSSLLALLIPTNPGEFWTCALTVATAVLAVVAYLGLRSVALSKKDMLNRARRESAQCAVDRCGEMARELLPLYMRIVSELAMKKVALFVSDPGQVSFEEREEVRKINSAIAWVGTLDRELQSSTIELMNRLECWSMSFTSNPALADEQLAFDPCSTAFCQMVMSLYPSFLTQRRANPASGPFQNVVTLFRGWYARKAQGPMLAQLERLQTDRSQLPSPIGARLD
jgi:hypothetical protein